MLGAMAPKVDNLLLPDARHRSQLPDVQRRYGFSRNKERLFLKIPVLQFLLFLLLVSPSVGYKCLGYENSGNSEGETSIHSVPLDIRHNSNMYNTSRTHHYNLDKTERHKMHNYNDGQLHKYHKIDRKHKIRHKHSKAFHDRREHEHHATKHEHHATIHEHYATIHEHLMSASSDYGNKSDSRIGKPKIRQKPLPTSYRVDNSPSTIEASPISLLSRHGGGLSRHRGGRSRHGGGQSRHGGGQSRHGGGQSRHGGGLSRHGGGRSRRDKTSAISFVQNLDTIPSLFYTKPSGNLIFDDALKSEKNYSELQGKESKNTREEKEEYGYGIHLKHVGNMMKEHESERKHDDKHGKESKVEKSDKKGYDQMENNKLKHNGKDKGKHGYEKRHKDGHKHKIRHKNGHGNKHKIRHQDAHGNKHKIRHKNGHGNKHKIRHQDAHGTKHKIRHEDGHKHKIKHKDGHKNKHKERHGLGKKHKIRHMDGHENKHKIEHEHRNKHKIRHGDGNKHKIRHKDEHGRKHKMKHDDKHKLDHKITNTDKHRHKRLRRHKHKRRQCSNGRHHGCSSTNCIYGEIVPRTVIFGEVNTDVTVYCNFNSSIYKPEEVQFKRWNKGMKVLPSEVVNATTRKLTLNYDSTDSFKLFCMAKTKSLCYRVTNIGSVPQDLVDFRCRCYDWETLECLFKLHKNPIPTSYFYGLERPELSQTTLVPFQDSDTRKSSGNITIDVARYISVRPNVTLVVETNNTLGHRVYRHFIDVFDLVIPGRPENLGSYNTSTNSSSVEWKISARMEAFHPGIHNELAVKMEGTEEWITEVFHIEPPNDGHKHNTVFTRNVSLPHPYMSYEVRMRLHTTSDNMREDMWSEPANITIKTLPTAPTLAVNIDESCFEATNVQNSRELIVYWQQLERKYHNGPDFEYQIRAYYSDTNQVVNHHPKIETGTFVRFDDMKKDRPYTFHIVAKNAEGISAEHAEVSIPVRSSMPDVPGRFNVIKYKNPLDESLPVYRLIWREPSDHTRPIVSYTIFWCDKPDYSSRCLYGLKWENLGTDLSSLLLRNEVSLQYLPLESSLYEKNLTDLPHDQIFGIAAIDSEGFSSGIKWASCTVPVDDSPPAPRTPIVQRLSSSRVEVRWDLECKDQAAMPLAVNLSYCEVHENQRDQCIGQIHYKKGKLSEPMELSTLRPSSTVAFYLSILSVVGASKNSRATVVTLEEDVPSGAPMDLAMTGRGNTSIGISWSPPPQDLTNGLITRYAITTIPITFQRNHNKPTLGHNEMSLTNLSPFTSYVISVSACTSMGCSRNHVATIELQTLPGVPEEVDLEAFNLNSLAGALSWADYDTTEKCHSKHCSFDVNVTYNGSEYTRKNLNQSSISLEDLDIVCEDGEPIYLNIRAVGYSKKDTPIPGPWKFMETQCTLPGPSVVTIVSIVTVTLLILLLIILFICLVSKRGWRYILDCKKWIDVPELDTLNKTSKEGMGDMKINPQYAQNITTIRASTPYEDTSKKMPLLSQVSQISDVLEDERERHGRNLSGDSSASGVSSEADSALVSGGHDTSSDGSDVSHNSQEDGERFGVNVRQRAPGPYVRHGVRQNNDLPNGYVAARSNPNLAMKSVGNTPRDGYTPHTIPNYSQQMLRSTPDLANPNQYSLFTPATSAGYFSTTESDSDILSLSNLPKSGGNAPNRAPPYCTAGSPLPHYSRHSFIPPQFKPTNDNIRYVTVAAADEESRLNTPESLAKRRPPSMPSLSHMGEDPYCVVGKQSSPPATSHGYVTAGTHIAEPYRELNNNSKQPQSAKSTGSYIPHKQPEEPIELKASNLIPNNTGYVTLGERNLPSADSARNSSAGSSLNSSRNGYVQQDPNMWARSIPLPDIVDFADEVRDIASAPCEVIRGRYSEKQNAGSAMPFESDRPRTSDGVISRPKKLINSPSGWHLGRPSLSKQSSGYVSQEALGSEQVLTPGALLFNKPEQPPIGHYPSKGTSV